MIFSLYQRFEGYFFFRHLSGGGNGGQGELFNFHEKSNPNCPVGKNIHRVLDESLLEVQKNFEEELKEHTVAEVYVRMGEVQNIFKRKKS